MSYVCVLIRDRKGEDTDTQRSPCENGGRDWSDASTNQERPGIASSHSHKRGMEPQNLREKPTLLTP